MKKKHTTKKRFTEKYFTKAFVKTHIIPISAIGVLVGATVITLSVYFGVTSCKSNSPTPIPSDAKVIDSNIDNKYIVPNVTDIWTSNATKATGAHNKLLDLALYTSDKHINTSNFVIKDEVDFGILVNFDENINLYGYPQSLIELGTKDSRLTTNAYGIIVGSTSQPPNGKDTYSGKMDIDNSVNVSIYCSISNGRDSFGVYFSNVTSDSIDIAGAFRINSGIHSCGVKFNWVLNSNINIGGAFTITNGLAAIYFDNFDDIGVVDSNINIDGVFNLSGDSGILYGVCFLQVSNANVDIDGTFTFMSYDVNIYAICFMHTDNTSINIGGVFILSDAHWGYLRAFDFYHMNDCNINIDVVCTTSTIFGALRGINFEDVTSSHINIDGVFAFLGNAETTWCVSLYNLSDTDVNINGLFTLDGSSEVAIGVELQNAVNANININGVFALINNWLDKGGIADGCSFNDVEGGSININGTFALASSETSSVHGITFDGECNNVTYNTTSIPQFFSNKINSDNLRTKFPASSYKWNGAQINSSNPTPLKDDSLNSRKVQSYNPNFWIDVITTDVKKPGNDYNQNIFNRAYEDGLDNYIENHPTYPADVIDQFKNIIDSIPYK